MPELLQNEVAVLAAAERLLGAGRARRDVEDATRALIAETSVIPLDHLDAWERKLRAAVWASDYAASGRRWLPWRKPVRLVSWLDLCSGDGFRREQVLRTTLAVAPNRFFCALTLRRLNDWVPQVRAAACERLPQIAERWDRSDVVDALWITLAHGGSWGRMRDSGWQVLADLIANSAVAAELKCRIVAASAGPAAVVLSQVGRTPILDPWLADIASAATQPAVRAKATRWLLDGRAVWVTGRRWAWTDLKWCKGRFEPVLGERAITHDRDFGAVLRKALADRSPIVRRVGAEFLIKHLGTVVDDAARLAHRLAADPSASVAERGRFALARLADQM